MYIIGLDVIGLDVHKNSSYYSMIDDAGREVKKGRFPTTREGLEKFSGDLPGDAKVALRLLHRASLRTSIWMGGE